MKRSHFIFGLVILTAAHLARAQLVLANQDWNVGTAIPEGNPVGITVSQTFTGLPSAPIMNVSVDLNISGGYNGGLYAYLTLQDANGDTATEVLLNQVGTSSSNPFGSAGSGFNIVLSDSGTANGSIHNATGNPTGIWQPDSPNTLDSTFGGLTANGTWTLFIADEINGGGTSTIESWGLSINGEEATAVPEPSTAITGALAGMFLLMALGQSLVRRFCHGYPHLKIRAIVNCLCEANA